MSAKKLGILIDGIIDASDQQIGITEIELGIWIIGTELEGGFEMGEGMGDFVLASVGGAEIVVSGGVFIIVFQRELEVFDRFVEFSFRDEDVAEVIMHFDVIRVNLE